MADAPAGSAYVGQDALNHYHHATYIAPTLKLLLEALAIPAYTVGYVGRGFAFHGGACWNG